MILQLLRILHKKRLLELIKCKIDFYFSGSYIYNDGCTHGLDCTRGMFCGNLKDEACRNCSFEDCLNHAKRSRSYAFSYTTTSKQFCRLCDEKDVVKRTPYRGWGIYMRGKHSYAYSLVHIGSSNRLR